MLLIDRMLQQVRHPQSTFVGHIDVDQGHERTMSKQTAASQPKSEGAVDHIQRCAVCKIDLKGRFVYTDAEFEQLIGRSQDELFGRPLTDITPEQDHEIINSLLTPHSQYESIHEAARIRLIDDTGVQRPVAMVCALNFVAGNAVNFQVVFHTLAGSSAPRPVENTASTALDPILAALAGRAESPDWAVRAVVIRDLAEAVECLVYRVDGDSLVLMTTSADPAGGSQAISVSGPTDDLHWWLAQAGEEYRFDNSEHVQAALEAVAEAPTELIMPSQDAENVRYLIRCVYDTDPAQCSAQLAAAMDRTQLFVRLLCTGADDSQASPTVPTNVGDLPRIADLLSVGVGELQADDSLSRLNQALALQLHGRHVSTLKELLAVLTAEHDTIGRKMITDAIRTCRSAGESTQCSVRVTGPDDVAHTLTVIREHTTVDCPLWLCVQPCRQSSVGAAISRSAVLQLLEYLQRLVATASESATPLTHAAFAGSSATGKLQLVTLTDALHQAAGLVSELQQISSLAGRPRKVQEVNLNMLVGQIFERLRREAAPTAVNLACGDLPIVRTACAELETALLAILRIMMTEQTGATCHLRLDATGGDDELAITCAVKSPENHGRPWLDRLTGAIGGADRILHDQLALAVALDTLQGRLEAASHDPHAVRLILPRA